MQIPKETKLLDQEAKVEQITQKRAKKRNQLKSSCHDEGYLFEANLQNFYV
jgi:hypothetical protein